MMNRVIRVSVFFAVLLALTAGVASAQGSSRTFMERRIWYVDPDGRTGEAVFWRIFLGQYEDVKFRRRIPGQGDRVVSASMNFQLVSSGYIEGNGVSSEQGVGRVSIQPHMRIRLENGEAHDVLIDAIDYIYDYGTKVALKDGRKGDFLIHTDAGMELDVRRFQLTEFRTIGEELKETTDRMSVVVIAFSSEALPKARAEPVTDVD